MVAPLTRPCSQILSDPKRKSMFDQYGATEEAASQAGSGYGPGAAGFDPSEIFKNIFAGGFGNGGFDIFGSSTTGGFSHANLDVAVPRDPHDWLMAFLGPRSPSISPS